jgi:hypothetical protein
MTSSPPTAASRIPARTCGFRLDQPPCGGCTRSATTAFTIGAPAKTIDITTAGLPFAPNASSTHSAPIAPAVPARIEKTSPFAGYVQLAPALTRIASGASTATSTYATPTHRKALMRPFSGSPMPSWPRCSSTPYSPHDATVARAKASQIGSAG